MKRLRLGATVVVALGALCTGSALADDSQAAPFGMLDADQDGYVTKAEIKAKPALTRTMQISTYGSFELADIDDDGRLTAPELAAFEEQLPVE